MDNPFAAPSAEPAVPQAREVRAAGPWRRGERVVAQSDRVWVERCAKCNRSTDLVLWVAPVRRRSPWFYPVLLAGIIPFLLFRRSLVRHGRVRAHLCRPHRNAAVAWQVGTPLLAVALGFGAMALSSVTEWMFLYLVPLAAIVAVAERPRGPVFARRIDGDRIEIGGVGEGFWASLSDLDPAEEKAFRTQTAKDLDALAEIDP